ncbi:MAG: hypothetical protein EPO55_16490 [Reyranella sp.]|uniref:hypothetical protein n=1 Tax=Reyranella sp. TaxID=1929291 RepID=UPI00122789D2|nr:hypothetical protein [Reyranella sp.]TAJ38194.1 MAG: hypothetical protein EPO55_16490 [Reyranella sp.]
MTMEAGEVWSAAELLTRVLRGPVKRRTPPRLRVFFLRQLRQCGEVSLAAKRTGVPLSTVYRWRKRDAKFRERWEAIQLQRRDIIEDRLMAIVREGELRSVYHKGLEVGWRRTFTHLASIRVLDYFSRQAGEKMSHDVSRSTAPESAKKSKGSAA